MIELREVPEQTGKPSHRKAVFRCHCGGEFIARRDHIRSGHTKSCGCSWRSRGGLSGSRAYNTWRDMIRRTSNPAHKYYGYYGGRGIRVCERWQTFANFHADMGDPPEGHSLDRIDNDGDYCPQNCRWATGKDQARNRRVTVRLTISGETKPLAEWCELSGVNYETARKRRGRGWTDREIIFGGQR